MFAKIILTFSMTFLLWACAGLIPQDLAYFVQIDPVLPDSRGDISLDAEDSSAVFSKEGVLIKVKHMNDTILNQLYPPLFDGRHVNPYTHDTKSEEKGYIPPRFTVFDVSVHNKTYAKIEFDPAKSVLQLDNGEEYRYYDPGREGAVVLGGNSFSKYYGVELGISGNEKNLVLERMGLIYKSIYHRHRPVFKDTDRKGFLIFDPLPEETKEIVLKINEFVLSFDPDGNPENTIDIEYRFIVDQGVVGGTVSN